MVNLKACFQGTHAATVILLSVERLVLSFVYIHVFFDNLAKKKTELARVKAIKKKQLIKRKGLISQSLKVLNYNSH